MKNVFYEEVSQLEEFQDRRSEWLSEAFFAPPLLLKHTVLVPAHFPFGMLRFCLRWHSRRANVFRE